jgi:hypothetical protein
MFILRNMDVAHVATAIGKSTTADHRDELSSLIHFVFLDRVSHGEECVDLPMHLGYQQS